MKLWMFATALTLAAGPALALDVSKSVSVTAAPADVWKAIGPFCSIGDWHPAIASCTLSSKGHHPVRTLALKGGGTITEEQVSRSNKGMRYTYVILSGPLPVANYKSTISVAADGSGAKISWMGHFDAKGAPDDKATDTIAGIYDAGLKSIADKFH